MRDEVAAIGAGQHLAFGAGVGITQVQAQQEPVHLRIGQREGAGQVDRVLRGDHEKRLRQRVRGAVERDLVFGHGFEQGALRARRRAVDFVRQQQLGEHRAGVEAELARGLVVDGHADDVRGQQVGRELHALEIQAQGRGHGARQGGLAQAGQVFDEQVAAGKQRGERQLHFAWFAQHQLVDLGQGVVEGLAGALG